MAIIAWIETEQERKLSTIWVINASFQLINVIGKKQRINTKEEFFTGQDIWQEPIADTFLKNKSNFVFNYKLKKYKHFSETPMCYDDYRLQKIRKGLFKYALK